MNTRLVQSMFRAGMFWAQVLPNYLLSKGLLTHEHTARTKYVPGGHVLGSGSPIGLRIMNIVSVSLWVSRGQSVWTMKQKRNEPRLEKTNVLHMRKQRRRSASR